MAKASWGIKRTCQNCGARFYDLNKNPMKCPKCGREHEPEDFVKVRRTRGGAAATAAAAAAAAKAAAAKAKKAQDALAGDDVPDVEADDPNLVEADDLEDENSDIEIEVADDKEEADR